ncbi:DNA polymerase-3 subunit alpha [Halanaerobium congolense]|jgi:DNA polymerase-3 subunit alpha|uniref:DNA-directed DNA polymerase n=1 Tax=Halanaerobium congolense TaxID=54121 RepID=A0A1M7J0F0_9FIRM|nr:DNA polymerase III subunit alpha [Halanaerobium congolense]PTX15448.1 DNA polymerase-3 subunit alpha [Halanaerobium congolense]TDP21581.1 DNA polymerase-3 subunit alpha [Halanaerobium congolense]SDF05743.1 DNA polymerase-3 subunit alpha [Halanaerobium congolense]SES73718.1 DNA polymerase-3 subunit alpha [Halanaerobium congolense]SFP17865.1 DNA polymerase-3 subunit alpha [Halanaerobium congolense]
MSDFVHLHNHTAFSLLDGAIRVDSLIKKTKKYDMPAAAITDHGVLYGIIDFYRKAKKEGIKPIIGAEVYLSPGSRFEKNRKRYHLVLLAQNNEGYHNLIQLVSKAWLEGFYYKPRVDKELLAEYSKGLICLSACIQGEIPQLLINGNYDLAQKAVSDYHAIFGKDNFFLELQNHNLQQEKEAVQGLLKLSREENIPTVVTNDCHYLNKEDAELQDILLALQTGTTLADENRMTFTGQEFYYKSPAEMLELFPDLDSAYQNTVKIADRVEVDLDFNHFYLPEYPDLGQEKSPEDLLKKLCLKGLKAKGMGSDQKAVERLKYELKIIFEMGYAAYFLIVYDFVKYAEDNEIMVGPGRGSAAGSLVAYLLNITKVNPLKYGLIFERFLNPERVTMPDIDIDFDENRDQIIEYVKERYGTERVAQIGTFGTMAARAAVRDVGRVLAVPYAKVDKVAKLISSRKGINQSLKDQKKLQELYHNDGEIKELIDYARGVEGLPRHISTHAAGVIIGAEPLTQIVPLQKQDESVITQLPMGDLEALGLLKMDFLGLRNLTVIKNTLQLIEDRKDKVIDINNIPLDDSAVYKFLSTGKTAGVFQMESYLFQSLNKKMKPDRFSDLIAMLALGRPGPLGSNIVDDFIAIRHGKKEAEYLHPKLKPILEETFGMILYQEQVMEIASNLAGYSMGEADLLRRGMGKKKLKLVAAEREKFVKGAVERGLTEAAAQEIFDQMEYFAGYGFNKSHSTAYAFLAYQTAYLKYHFPVEFMSALFSSVMGNHDKIADYIKASREINLKILAPDINNSHHDFFAESDKQIRYGLKAIKNVGSAAIEAVIKARKVKKFSSLIDFLKRVDISAINIQSLEAFIKAGAFDQIAESRASMLLNYEELYNKYNNLSKRKAQGQQSFAELFNDENKFMKEDLNYTEVDELKTETILEQEKEFLGIYLSAHPLDQYQNKLEKIKPYPIKKALNISEGRKVLTAGYLTNYKEHVTKRNNKMAFLTINDQEEKIEIIIFSDIFRKINFDLSTNKALLVYGEKVEGQIIAKKIISLNSDLLLIDVSEFSKKRIMKLKKYLLKKEGNVSVLLKRNNKLIITENKYNIDNNQLTKDELARALKKSEYKYI